MAKPKVTQHKDGHLEAGDNPYDWDFTNVGADLGTLLMDKRIPADTVEIMSYGTWGNADKRQFQIIDKTTGERWVITL